MIRRDRPIRSKKWRRILGIGASTVRRRIEDGSIPVVQGLGRVKRIPKWWIDEKVRPPADESP